jgi:hypothetical protein
MIAKTWPYRPRQPARFVTPGSARRFVPGSKAVEVAPKEDSAGIPLRVVLFCLAGHALLAIGMHILPVLATAHAWISFAVACCVALTSREQARVVYAVGYLAASEVLWRMTSAGVFWEFGKYGVSAVLLLSLFRHRPKAWNWLAIAYFLLLIPSTLLTCTQVTDVFRLRAIISDSLSGPFSLFICALCLYQARLTVRQAGNLVLTMLGPLTGVAAICSYATARLGADYDFGSESNFDVTGGFGPNQVSSALGLAILFAFFWIQFHRGSRVNRFIGVALVLCFFAMAALTFSRTGVWMGLGTILVASAFIVRDRRRLLSAVASLVLLATVGYFVVFPMLDSLTSGKLSARFQEKGFTGREDIAKGDLELGLRHPVMGVGLGMVKQARARELGIGGAAHTEFTRLIAEHGLLGLLALGALLVMGLQALNGNRTTLGRAWAASLLAYSTLFMLASGMRLVAPALAFGLALIQIELFRRTRGRLAPTGQLRTLPKPGKRGF